MARTYIKAVVRCRQLERLVVSAPGTTIEELMKAVGLSYQSTCVYMKRLCREGRVRVEFQDPAMAAKPRQFFHPVDPLRPPPKTPA